MRRAVGCPLQLRFHTCGCECPYLLARSGALAKWLTQQAWDPFVKEPTPWHRALHPKDAYGNLLARGLPYVEGLCVGQQAWQALHPGRRRPKKREASMPQERLERVDAFTPGMLQEVGRVRQKVQAAFERMRAC